MLLKSHEGVFFLLRDEKGESCVYFFVEGGGGGFGKRVSKS